MAVTTGSSLWLSTSARPWPGICLMIPTTPADAIPSSTARPERRDLHRFGAQSAVADDVGRARLADVEQRQSVDVDPALPKRQRYGPRVDPRRLDRRRRRHGIEPVERLRCRKGRPVGRLHPRDAPAFLVDQDRQIVAPRKLAQRIGELQQLFKIRNSCA